MKRCNYVRGVAASTQRQNKLLSVQWHIRLPSRNRSHLCQSAELFFAFFPTKGIFCCWRTRILSQHKYDIQPVAAKSMQMKTSCAITKHIELPSHNWSYLCQSAELLFAFFSKRIFCCWWLIIFGWNNYNRKPLAAKCHPNENECNNKDVSSEHQLYIGNKCHCHCLSINSCITISHCFSLYYSFLLKEYHNMNEWQFVGEGEAIHWWHFFYCGWEGHNPLQFLTWPLPILINDKVSIIFIWNVYLAIYHRSHTHISKYSHIMLNRNNI